MAYIERAITPILKKRTAESKCILITGARQIGKSTLVKHVFPEYNRANFDDRMTRLQAKEEPKLFFRNNPCPLFIDEVQKENGILEEIKRIVAGKGTLAERADALIEAANNNGGKDNIAVILIEPFANEVEE